MVPILDKQLVVNRVNKEYDCQLSVVKGKQIMYAGISHGRKIVLCTPSSKLHVNGNGWFDLTMKQALLLDNADIAILFVRMQGNKLYILDYKQLRRLMTNDNKLTNPYEGEHWKFFVWKNYIKVQGCDQNFPVSAELINSINQSQDSARRTTTLYTQSSSENIEPSLTQVQYQKIGRIAQTKLKTVLESGVIASGEIEAMLTNDYSKQTFDLQYPLLVRPGENFEHRRYYSKPLMIQGATYYMCSQWYETIANNDRPYLLKWLSLHS
ncbi:hypothetical protein ABWW58_08910 [Sporolactobacillus sp. STCC-11]|uniref:hypothetical protein n=1 Tax=Sporolactobacillus caesalpiniae TaxID=3230362 RepID=UPI0033920308